MKALFVTLLVLAIIQPAMADDLGNRLPSKQGTPPAISPPPIPELIRQGGDTIADAVPITIPTLDLAGTTSGYTDDYDVSCPFTGSTSPDVVYLLEPDVDAIIEIDMYGSQYDTRIWVLDETLDWPIACNDDYYPDYTSKIENLAVAGGETYYIVVDGYNGEHGSYLMDVRPSDDCDLSIPADAVHEGEPPLQAEYIDFLNGGCNTDPGNPPLQEISSSAFRGMTGWYLRDGAPHRDTDWFLAYIPDSGVLELTLTSEADTRLAEIGPQECSSVTIIQEVISDDCSAPTLAVVGEAGQPVWLWVGPYGYSPWELPYDAYEYAYLLTSNLGIVATEGMSWSGVKALYR